MMWLSQAAKLKQWLKEQFPKGLACQEFVNYFIKQPEFQPEHAQIMLKLVQQVIAQSTLPSVAVVAFVYERMTFPHCIITKSVGPTLYFYSV